MDICLKGSIYGKWSLSSRARLLCFGFEFGSLYFLVTLTWLFNLSVLLLPSVRHDKRGCLMGLCED